MPNLSFIDDKENAKPNILKEISNEINNTVLKEVSTHKNNEGQIDTIMVESAEKHMVSVDTIGQLT